MVIFADQLQRRFNCSGGFSSVRTICRMLRHREALARVRDLEGTVAADDQRYGPDDPRTVDSRLRLVKAYEDLGNAGDDRDLDPLATVPLTKAVDSRVRTLGPDHPDTLDVRYELAFLRYRQVFQDPPPGAAPHDELVTELRSIADDSARVLGPTHPKTLGRWWMLSRHCPESERPTLVQRVIRGWEHIQAERERQFGSDDPQTLGAMLNLVSLHQDDRPGEAQRLAEQMVAGWQRVAATRGRELGPVHPDTVTARERHLSLLDAWVARGSGAGLYEKLVADHVRLLGPDHPRTLRVQLELLGWKGLPGHATPETAAFAQHLLDRFRDVLGPDHDDFLMLRYHVMSNHAIAGDLAAAFDIRRRYPSPDDEEEPHMGEQDDTMR